MSFEDEVRHVAASYMTPEEIVERRRVAQADFEARLRGEIAEFVSYLGVRGNPRAKRVQVVNSRVGWKRIRGWPVYIANYDRGGASVIVAMMALCMTIGITARHGAR